MGGFTSLSGISGVSDMVSIEQVAVSNFDENTVGEDMKDVASKIQDAYKEMLTDDNRHFVDQKAQTDHLARLTGLISDHLASSKPEDDKLWQKLGSLERRVGTLDRECNVLVRDSTSYKQKTITISTKIFTPMCISQQLAGWQLPKGHADQDNDSKNLFKRCCRKQQG